MFELKYISSRGFDGSAFLFSCTTIIIIERNKTAGNSSFTKIINFNYNVCVVTNSWFLWQLRAIFSFLFFSIYFSFWYNEHIRASSKSNVLHLRLVKKKQDNTKTYPIFYTKIFFFLFVLISYTNLAP